MRFKNIKPHRVLIVVCLACVLLLICVFASYGSDVETKKAIPLRITGSYSVDGQEQKNLTDKIAVGDKRLHTVVISGRFTSDIPKDMVITMLMDNLRASVSINGREVFRSGDENAAVSKTAGNAWGFMISPGITQNDETEITLSNVYADRTTNVFDSFLNSMSYGYGYELYQTMVKEKMPAMLFSLLVIAAGAIALVVCIAAKLFKSQGMERGIALACVTIIGGTWIFFDGGYPYASLLFDNPRLFNTLDILQIFIIPPAFILFTYTCLENEKTKRISETVTVMALIWLMSAILLQLAGLYDLYELQSIAIAAALFVTLASIALLGYEALILKRRQALYILLSWLPLFVSVFAEMFNIYLRLIPERMTVRYGFSLSILLQFVQLVRKFRQNLNSAQKAVRLEYELLQSRIAVMLSQIQPHFLFNTLNDIRFLYRESPQQAENALVSFTKYLRGNMDSLNQTGLIPFEKELSHVENYVSIEKVRFGGKLKVDYDIACTRFFVPVLTVQPLVENAIRHGVMQKREGGTVTIRTYEDEHSYLIDVADDGAGFDPSMPRADDGDSHNGIENVRMRLKNMCGGSLAVRSRCGEGTVSTIQIPKVQG